MDLFALILLSLIPSTYTVLVIRAPPTLSPEQHFIIDKLWPNAVVPYQMDSTLAKPRRAKLIRDVMNVIENVTCVRFQQISDQPASNPKSPILYLTTGRSCSSFVGRQLGVNRQNLTLTRSCMNERGIAHELVHALGFAHEHARMDRDHFLEMDHANIHPNFVYTFNKEPDAHELLGYAVPYDFASIMHYGPYDFSIDRQRPTLKSRIDPFYVRLNYALSYLDIYKINLLYKCKRELRIFGSMCVDYLSECFWLSQGRHECKTDYVRNVCRKKCGLC